MDKIERAILDVLKKVNEHRRLKNRTLTSVMLNVAVFYQEVSPTIFVLASSLASKFVGVIF